MTARIRQLLALLSACPVLLLAAPAMAANQQVQVTDNAFVLPGVAVKPGESVSWTYQSTSEHHNVRFEDGAYTFPAVPSFGPWMAMRTFAGAGTYRYHCQEHGGPGGQGMSGIVYVNASGTVPGVAPTATFTVNPTTARVNQQVSFDASGSTDPDGTIVRHEWDLNGDGIYETDTGAAATTAQFYNTAGTRTIKLRVTDSQAHVSETTKTVTVVNPAARPSYPIVTPPAGTGTGPLPAVSLKVRILSSKRLRRVLSRGLRFEAGVPAAGLALRATLTARGRTLGSVRRTGLARGRVKLTLKLSRRGKARLRRLMSGRRRVRATLRVRAGTTTARARFTLRR